MRRTFAIVLTAALLTVQVACADTLAWWRFEDHPVGQKLDAELGTHTAPMAMTADSANRGNPLRTYNTRPAIHPPDTSGTFVEANQIPKLAGGVANTRAVRFVGNQDFYTNDDKQQPSPIESASLGRFTVEGLFKLSTLAGGNRERYQTILGKDGKPVDRLPFQPFVAVVAGRDDEFMTQDCLAINILDRAGRYRNAASRSKLERDKWYAFSAVCNGSTLKLYLNRFDGKGYQLEGETTVEDGMIESTGTWTVGRGAFNDSPTSWLQGFADEIRISDEPLAPEKWLMHGIDSLPDVPPPPVKTAPKPPLVARDIADPAVLLHEGAYYVYGTTRFPPHGFDVISSRDLKTWSKPTPILDRGPGVWGDDAFWAPGVIAHNGKVYLFYSTVGPIPGTGGQRSSRVGVAVADSPVGPFKEVVARMPLIGRAVIDPYPFIDADGKPWLYFVADVADALGGSGQIVVVPLSDDLLTPIGEPIPCLSPSQPWEGPTWNEGPVVFHTGDQYVLMYSGEFWASPNYAVGYATSPTPTGPWRKAEENPILHRYAGLRGTGHNSIAATPDGKGLLTFFHAHRSERNAARDTYVARLRLGRDLRGNVTVGVEPIDAEATTKPATEQANDR